MIWVVSGADDGVIRGIFATKKLARYYRAELETRDQFDGDRDRAVYNVERIAEACFLRRCHTRSK